ncbi:hypothetical protein PoB_000818700 [Plakobranchus ocellatus]|uniref:Uncharacterized protein n=1 Tax=Plakobranchus ocellatus TaxID=259542 RepID=A0AAV3YHJ0_9GAST|nr:hypothetical protein PoB_000818700 [Plakobranchus ocellatus]
MILHWIVADADPSEPQDLSKIPSSESDLSMQILDQDVDISEGRQHFSVEAWAKVLDLVKRKEKSHEWATSSTTQSKNSALQGLWARSDLVIMVHFNLRCLTQISRPISFGKCQKSPEASHFKYFSSFSKSAVRVRCKKKGMTKEWTNLIF